MYGPVAKSLNEMVCVSSVCLLHKLWWIVSYILVTFKTKIILKQYYYEMVIVVVWHVAILLMKMQREREKRKTKIKTTYFASFLWQKIVFSFQFPFSILLRMWNDGQPVTYPSTKYINFTFHTESDGVSYEFMSKYIVCIRTYVCICNINEIMYPVIHFVVSKINVNKTHTKLFFSPIFLSCRKVWTLNGIMCEILHHLNNIKAKCCKFWFFWGNFRSIFDT